MGSKPKSKTYIVHHRGKTPYGAYAVLGRYKVGARNPGEAEGLLRKELGKHIKAKVYYEDKNGALPHGMVIRDKPNFEG